MNIPQNVGPNENYLVCTPPFLLHKESQQFTHFGNHRSQPSTLDGVFGMVPKVFGAKSMANLISSSPCFQKMQIAYPQYLLGPEQFLFPLRILFSCPNDLCLSEIFQCVGRPLSIPKIPSFLTWEVIFCSWVSLLHIL